MAEVLAEQHKGEARLAPIRLESQEHAHHVWSVTVEASTDPLALEAPAYWALVANKLVIRDKIEVWWEDGTRYAEYVVRSTDRRTWAKLAKILETHFGSEDVAQTQAEIEALSAFKITWRSMHHKWSVVRKSDSQVLHEGEENKEDAENWLRGYLKSVQ